MLKSLLAAPASIFLAAGLLAGCASTASTSSTEPAAVAAKADIVDTAVGAGSFNTLVAAVQAADLVETLKSPGPFTVFAPTDEAFAALPEGTVGFHVHFACLNVVPRRLNILETKRRAGL
ncbi:MAG: fasciclin domain-containing protein, partial [Pseudomonadota bacterium]